MPPLRFVYMKNRIINVDQILYIMLDRAAPPGKTRTIGLVFVGAGQGSLFDTAAYLQLHDGEADSFLAALGRLGRPGPELVPIG